MQKTREKAISLLKSRIFEEFADKFACDTSYLITE